MLKVENLVAGYNQRSVLHSVSLEVNEGEIVGLIGLNGSGKSTLLKTIFGLLKAREGRILYAPSTHSPLSTPHEIQNRSPLANLRDGIVYAPQGNRIFDELTVSENLDIALFVASSKKQEARSESNTSATHYSLPATKDWVYDLFPALKGKRQALAETLSGGEKQQLALARTLIFRPRLLLIDEPTVGLAVGATQKVFSALKEINQSLSITILLAEQKTKDLRQIATRIYGLRGGRIVLQTPATDLTDDKLRTFFWG